MTSRRPRTPRAQPATKGAQVPPEGIVTKTRAAVTAVAPPDEAPVRKPRAGRPAAAPLVAPAPGHLASVRGPLLDWYDRNKRDLPWRRTKDPYAIWLSEVMLQQTQVSTVIPYWERFLKRFPTARALASAPLDDVLAGWKGLGYYSRARNLHRAAQEVVARFGGALPSTAAELLALPGFGRYTAGAVASIAFGEEAPLVDGNVARVFARVFEVEGLPGDRQREATLWALATALVKGKRPGDLNQALMEHGATTCRPENPLCLLCPVRTACVAFRKGRVDELPPAKVRATPKKLTLAVAVWPHAGTLLFARRADAGLFGGLWELPGAEIADDAPDTEARARLAAALGVEVKLEGALGAVKRQLTHRDLTLRLLRVSGARRPTSPPAFQELRWCTPADAASLGMSTAMQRALDAALATGVLAGG
ncbi:A/G-specific adenine glycosylase [Corallococcus macrosporus]|uniref:Adenine DNA glycosylase n=1 Tax=Myxococcus fulvus (strain ATCC BAA-855 / HW-1) TaxID=483219 RepID=F8CQA9_MYXFH|nr:A/G-specific adenine glycosylase [Corallococcus macrosporus]AEI65438.1 A/G-specific adenine glycosylase [Corallococcus macrosporus]